MKQVSEMPTSGQFVAVWQSNKWIEHWDIKVSGDMYIHEHPYDGDIGLSKTAIERLKQKDIAYFIAD